MDWGSVILGVITPLGTIIAAVLTYAWQKKQDHNLKIADEKRRVYEECLRAFPDPVVLLMSDRPNAMKLQDMLGEASTKVRSVLQLYANVNVLSAAAKYLVYFGSDRLIEEMTEEDISALVDKIGQAQNDLILEMRKDVMRSSSLLAASLDNLSARA
ncbi:hypothetical protein GEU84_010410 [Fertoebacter nigrum]|uniref:Uncharacterized protein n=1 Tax=Fertoeibacter niger TaxID=2656921 RepID=A0A8X8KPE2_9RHOB|nr:hypothetical protein [Fertoeibacter niger]NUB44796.1 hypothetical protein [Fertoeibacter niger]